MLPAFAAHSVYLCLAAAILFCTAAGDVLCVVQLTNTGNMRLTGISVTGDQNDCNFNLLWPSEAVNCSMSR
jgi:hypothetical protein